MGQGESGIRMKLGFGKFWVRGNGEISESGLHPVIAASPGELAKTLAVGLTATLLFCVGLYICISGLVIAFLALVR